MDTQIISDLEDYLLRVACTPTKCAAKWFDISRAYGTDTTSNMEIPATAKLTDLDVPLNWSFLIPWTGDDGKPGNTFAIAHLRMAERKDLAGLPYHPNAVAGFVWDFTPGYKFPETPQRFVTAYSPTSAGLWLDIARNRRSAEHDMMVQHAIGLQFNGHLNWNVNIGWEGSPYLRFPCDSDRIKEIFKLRDVPEGQRKDAIIHWIRNHKRTLNAGTVDEKIVDVVGSLRGVYDFGWRGMNVKVYPSRFDLNRFKKETKKVQELRFRSNVLEHA